VSDTGLLVLGVCLLAGGTIFFSVNAIALRTLSRLQLHEAFKRICKKERARDIAEKLIDDAEKLILTCSVYRIVFNVCILLLLLRIFSGRAAVEEEAAIVLTASDCIWALIAAAAIFTAISLAIPHAWAKYAGEEILSRTHRILTVFAMIASPILYILRLHDGLVRRLAGVPETTLAERQEEKQEEFLSDLEEHRMEGAVDEEEQEMIENVLELSETSADEIMTPRTDIVALEAEADLQKVLDTIAAEGHTRVPVYEKNIDNIIGLVYAKDLLAEIGKDPAAFKLRDRIRNAYFVPETKLLRILLHEFQNQKLHIAVVLDEYGGTAGVVTLEDILEELVGEITDEYEEIPPEPIRQIDADTIDVDARTYIDDLNDQFELNLPEDEDYDTIGGFVFSRLGYIPKNDETFDHESLKFTITAAEARRINRIKIQKAGTK
jgi:CBS domain containing-hemolysin-like protein